MKNDTFFDFENNRYMLDQNQLYIAKDDAFIKCDDEEYFDFFHELLNTYVKDEKRYLDHRNFKLSMLENELKSVNAFSVPIQHSK